MRVVILCGGRTPEHEVSTASGAAVARAAAHLGHSVALVDPAAGDGRARGGVLAALTAPPLLDELLRADVVVPALHGGWGGDGHLQALLELAGVPFTGARSEACALAWDKPRTFAVLRAAGVSTPDWSGWRHGREDPPDGVWRMLESGPIVVKGATGTSQRTLQLVRTPAQLREACELAHHGEGIVATPYLPGREFIVPVVGARVLPVTEVVLQQPLLDYSAKVRADPAVFVCPAEIPAAFARELTRRAQAVHRALGLGERAPSCVGFRCDDAGDPQCLDVDACPDLRSVGPLARAARAAGRTYPDLVGWIMDLAVAPAAAFTRRWE